MICLSDDCNRSRRAFLKGLAATGCLAGLGHAGVLAGLARNIYEEVAPNPDYRFSILSVDRFEELQSDIDTLKKSGKLSDNETYRSYIDDMRFVLPEDFQSAKSVIMIATFTRSMTAVFHYRGREHKIVIPPQYYDDGVTVEDVKDIIRADVIGDSGHRIERASGMHLKLLAVRSGLGRYGRNNICYVDGMGSFITLYAFLTDFEPQACGWNPVALMDRCEGCSICRRRCPTGAIRKDEFVIDAGRCVTLYSEIDCEFPEWMPRESHNALVGCMRCQDLCPMNRDVVGLSGTLEDVTEEETVKILEGRPDDALLESLTGKLKSFYPAGSRESFPIFTRNLGVLIGRDSQDGS